MNEITCGTEVSHHSVGVPSPQLTAGKDYTVEWHIVLGHEVKQLHL